MPPVLPSKKKGDDRRFSPLKGFKKELTALTIALASLAAYMKITYPEGPPEQKTKEITPANNLQERLNQITLERTLEQQKAFDEEVEKIVAHIKAEIEKAKEEGKPPLVHLLEEHIDRDVLAKELAVMSRLRDECGIKDISLEISKIVIDDGIAWGQKSIKGIESINRYQSILDGKNPEVRKQLSPELLQKLPKLIKDITELAIDCRKETYNALIVNEAAKKMGMNVKLANLPDMVATVGDVTQDDGFFKSLPITDAVLIEQNKKGPTARLLVTGSLHGLAVSKGLSDQYHVIPVNLTREPAMSEGLEIRRRSLTGIAKIKESRGEKLNEEETRMLDLDARTQFYMHAFQATRNTGVSSVTVAINTAKASPNVKSFELGDTWSKLDKFADEQYKGRGY